MVLAAVGSVAAFELAIQSFAAGFGTFVIHAGVTAIMLVVAVVVYVLLTPHREMELIRAGNTAAAVSLGAVIVGLALPLAVGMATSLTWADIVLWGAATLLVQLFVFRLVDLLLPGLPNRIKDGDMAAATLLAGVKIATAMILAAAVSGAPLARL